MISKNLKRFGDTSFRIKHQVNFYFNIIEMIESQQICDYDQLKNKIKEEKLVNYKNIPYERINLLIKQMKNFDLLDVDGNKKQKNKKIIKLHNFDYLQKISKIDINAFYEKTGLDLIKILFGYLMINDKKLTTQFNYFIDYLNQDNEINDNAIWLFAICENIEEFFKYKYFNKQQIIDLIFRDVNETDVVDYMEDKIEFKDILHKYDYEMRKPFSEINDIKEFLIYLYKNQNINSNDVKIYLGENKKLKKIINEILNFFKLKIDDLIIKKSNLMSYYLKIKKRNLIFKEYGDINRRWFTGIGLFEYQEGKKLKLSKKYLNVFTYLKQQKDLIIDDVKQIVIKEFNDSGLDAQYPYDFKTITKVLKEFNDKNYNYDKICDELKIFNVSEPTLFEYLINLAFAISYDYSPNDFRNKYSNTILDDNLKPRSHAVGKQPDGFIEDFDVNTIVSTIESTILRNKEIHKEKEPIQRHAIDLLENNKEYDNDKPNCLFIVKNDININNIIYFSSYNNSKYINDMKKEVRIIILDLRMFTKILESNKLTYLLRRVINKLPFSDESYIENIKEWYTKLVTDI